LVLYDTLECDYPLPDPMYQDLEFQTGDLEWFPERYTITKDGRLLKQARGRLLGDGGRIILESDVPLPVHGVLQIHAADPLTDHGLIEYRVRFLHGRVERILRWEGFGAERRRRLPRWESVQTPPPRRLQPDVMGRPITAEELALHAPRALELAEGRIAGDKGLLLLILTGLGVRRAAALLGYEVWRKGLE
jgi:hypothetical protein